jgi:hypothetical protein
MSLNGPALGVQMATLKAKTWQAAKPILLGVIIVGCAGLTGEAEAQTPITVSVVPVANHPDGSLDSGVQIDGSNITLPSGGRRVFLEIRIGDWDPEDTGVLLTAYQWNISSAGFANEFGATIGRAFAACTSTSDCVAAFGEGSRCDAQGCEACVPLGECCPASFLDKTRTDFVMSAASSLCAADLCVDWETVGDCVMLPGTVSGVDDPEPFPDNGLYAGTLILDVPADALGSFEVILLPQGERGQTVLIDGNGAEIPGLELVHGSIIIAGLGSCCYRDGGPLLCANGLSEAQCGAMPDAVRYTPGVSCDHEPNPCPDCNRNGVPDDTDIAQASRDCNVNGKPDECESVPDDPLIGVTKNRYLTVFTDGLSPNQAIRVTLDDLAPPFHVYNGQQMWVAASFILSLKSLEVTPTDNHPSVKAATLQCVPHFEDWTGFPYVEVFHALIVPDSSYSVEAFEDDGDGGLISVSGPATISTNRWGDLVAPFDANSGYWPAPDDIVGVPTDVVAALDSFRSIVCAPSKVRVDLDPATPDGIINIIDVVRALDAFKGLGYPFAPGPDPCP